MLAVFRNVNKVKLFGYVCTVMQALSQVFGSRVKKSNFPQPSHVLNFQENALGTVNVSLVLE